ncbi:putative phosphoglycerate mutase [Breoghania corrubedonensis]|uniref:Putative phosphoglycerate mutase n=1 Tax=Breoghania corrubedonensis TaxID=665038 RepID=A0A2T5VEL1_9HYPH|nr:histidine phosphatase family protein [Breoghania corrubedonensis]PTW62187.1 putative phosphoglycerate mutase [Breoghania corrubedonensis]
MSPTMIFIRHGETPWNVEGRLQGQREVDMSDVGRDQARRNGRAVKAYFEASGRDPESFAYLASPMRRTCETMRLVRTEIGLDPTAFERRDVLRELTFGEWEGSTLKELKAQNRRLVRARRADKWGFVPPGGESYAGLSRRIAGWLETMEGDAVVVTHGGVLRVLRGLLFSAPSGCLPVRPIDQDRVLVVQGRLGTWL